MAEIGVKSKRLHTNVKCFDKKVATKKEEQTTETRETQTDAFRQYTPSTCFTQRSAYFRVFSVVDLLLCLLSAGRWSFSSFRVLITSFCVLALADSSLLQVAHIHAQRRVRQGKQSLGKRLNNRHNSWLCYYVRCFLCPKECECPVKWQEASSVIQQQVVHLPAAAGWRVVLLRAQQAEGIWTARWRWTMGVRTVWEKRTGTV